MAERRGSGPAFLRQWREETTCPSTQADGFYFAVVLLGNYTALFSKFAHKQIEYAAAMLEVTAITVAFILGI